jgi:hypothetical protein
VPLKDDWAVGQKVQPGDLNAIATQVNANTEAIESLPGGGGSGDMLASVYDPTNVAGDAFDQDNMVNGTANKNFSAGEQTKLAGIENLADVTDAANVAAAGAQMTSGKNANNGYAGLDSSGLVPASLLPSYVDDVIEAANFAALTGGVAGKIYVTLDNNKTYRWSGSAFVEISPSPGSTDSVTEGSTNLYYTQARADARVVAGITGKADKATTISAGTGLTGGGDLSTNRTLAVSYGTAAGTAAQGNDARLSDERVPTNNSVTNAKMADDAIGIDELSATGTPSSNTYLRGDNTWSAPSIGGLTAQAAYTATAETIASGGAYADLTTTTDQVTIDVGPAGVAVVSIGAWFGASAANAQAYISFAVSGANTSVAADSKCVYVRAVAGSSVIGGTESSFTLTGLTPGSTTFKMKYKAAGGTGTYEHRRISVLTF